MLQPFVNNKVGGNRARQRQSFHRTSLRAGYIGFVPSTLQLEQTFTFKKGDAHALHQNETFLGSGKTCLVIRGISGRCTVFLSMKLTGVQTLISGVASPRKLVSRQNKFLRPLESLGKRGKHLFDISIYFKIVRIAVFSS